MKTLINTLLLCLIGLLLPCRECLAKGERILIILDATSGMNGSLETGVSKYTKTSVTIAQLLDSMYLVNDSVMFALHAYGNLKTDNCHNARQEIKFAKDNRGQIMLRLDDIKPHADASLAFALQQATPQLRDTQFRYTIIIAGAMSTTTCNTGLCTAIKTIQNITDAKLLLLHIGDTALSGEVTICANGTFEVNDNASAATAVRNICDLYRKPPETNVSILKTSETASSTPYGLLFINTVYTLRKMSMWYRADTNLPYTQVTKPPNLPMQNYEALATGHYKINYEIWVNEKIVARTNEFKILERTETIITLD